METCNIGPISSPYIPVPDWGAPNRSSPHLHCCSRRLWRGSETDSCWSRILLMHAQLNTCDCTTLGTSHFLPWIKISVRFFVLHGHSIHVKTLLKQCQGAAMKLAFYFRKTKVCHQETEEKPLATCVVRMQRERTCRSRHIHFICISWAINTCMTFRCNNRAHFAFLYACLHTQIHAGTASTS